MSNGNDITYLYQMVSNGITYLYQSDDGIDITYEHIEVLSSITHPEYQHRTTATFKFRLGNAP